MLLMVHDDWMELLIRWSSCQHLCNIGIFSFVDQWAYVFHSHCYRHEGGYFNVVDMLRRLMWERPR